MELSSMGIINTNTIVHYPSGLITRMIRATQNNDPVSTMLKNNLEEQRAISPLKFTPITPVDAFKNSSGVFASALVHEVRNPLTNINLAAEILASGTLNEDQKKLVEIINRGVIRMNNLLADFLEASKKGQIHAEICSVNELLEEVLAVNKDRILLKNVSVIRDYAKEDWKILVKKEEVKLALINIIINAIEAMPMENATLILSTGLVNDKCTIAIEDNGIGISEKNLENIFDPYYTNKPQGSGLGLSTTLDILLSNCGTLEVKSEEGFSTCFTLFFDIPGKA